MGYKSEQIDQYKAVKSSLEKLYSDVAAELEQIRSDKIEIQSLKKNLENLIDNSYYLRDDNRIIISAPDIIIGNVGRDGTLLAGGSTITLRGQDIKLEGVGADALSAGSVVTRASTISNIAVDPGIDGQESVVKGDSSIMNLARNVVMQSENAESMFLYPTIARGGSGVHIQSDTSVNIGALVACDTKKEYLTNLSSSLSNEKSELTSECKSLKTTIDDYMKMMDSIISLYITPITSTSITTLTNNQEMLDAQKDFDLVSNLLCTTMGSYFDRASRLAEVNRQSKLLDDAKSKIESMSSKMKSNNVNTQVNINSEFVGISSVDGDGNIRETPASMFSVNARSVIFSTKDKDKKQIQDSSIDILSNKINLSTVNPKISNDSSEFPAEGDVNIISKNIKMESVDYKLDGENLVESLLTKDGTISMRASKISGDTTSTDGKNDGIATLNAKRVEVKSMDVDKDSRADKSMSADGVMLLNSEKIYLGGNGSTKEEENSKLLQLVSSEMALFGSKTLELQQGKAIVQLSGDKFAASGSETAIYGKTTMAADVKFNGKASGGSADFKCLDVATAFKGPSISDGVGVAAAGAASSLSAKLKQEELAKAPAGGSEGSE